MIKNLNPLTFSEYGSVYTSAEYACLKKETPKTITFTEASPLFYTGEYQLYLDVVEYPTLLEIMYEQDCLSVQQTASLALPRKSYFRRCRNPI